MELEQRYRLGLLAAFVRGCLASEYAGDSSFELPQEDLDGAQLESLFELGKAAGLKLHKFKIKDDLPRVSKVMGLLRGIQFESLMDVGTGRGVFMWPFLAAFPWVKVTCLEILPHRVRDLEAIRKGGFGRIEVLDRGLEATGLADASHEVVTLLEVLEHIPNCELALAEACRIAEKAILISVPSKPEDNPEHIHIFTPERLREMLRGNGIERVRFHSVLNHIVLIALKNP